MKCSVILVGGRASGKSTLGRQLAGELGKRFVDTDRLVEQDIGCTIADYVEKHGWEAFRDVESRVLEGLADSRDVVVATGGGMVLRAENRERMRRNGVVLYMRAAPEVLASRLEHDPEESQRPSLTGRSIAEEIRQVMEEREDLYSVAAHHVLDAAAPLDILLPEAVNAVRIVCESSTL